MKFLVRGEPRDLSEWETQFSGSAVVFEYEEGLVSNPDISPYDGIVDFLADVEPQRLALYQGRPGLLVLANAVRISLAEMTLHLESRPDFLLAGFNGLPTLLKRELLEVSLIDKSDLDKLDVYMAKLDAGMELIDDRVGMVTPRVVCMIINEAYFTVLEGTAVRSDIDLAMKLGTNYPYGPFEWCEKMGIDNVYEVLEAVYEDTKDERYKICPALKKDYLDWLSHFE